MEGSHCELAAFGHSRDGKRGKPQIEYGLLTGSDGCPVAVRVFAGNTADPKAFIQAAGMVRDKFHITEAVMVGDRGMITSARIKALKEVPGMAWLTCLRAPAINKLAEDGGPLQMSLFDQQDLAEISSPDYPGERLIACHNPALAGERAAHRERLLAATETELTKIAAHGGRRARSTTPPRSASASARSSTSARSPSTSSPTSARGPSPGGATSKTSPPRPPSTASTSSAPPSPQPNSTPRPPWPPTKTSPM